MTRIGDNYGILKWERDKRTVGAFKSGGHVVRKINAVTWLANGGGIASMIGFRVAGHHDEQEHAHTMSDMTEKLDEATEQIISAERRFLEARGKFNANIKNEIASVEAASKKIAGEFDRINGALLRLTAVYTSSGFVNAIENAERLAAALASIQSLTTSKLTFAVIDHGQPEKQSDK